MTLSALIARVEEGSNEDRDLDIAIFRELNPDFPPNREPLPWTACFTTSLDDVLSLIEQKLPGWCWAVERMTAERYEASAFTAINSWDDLRSGTASSPARALLAATLRALSFLEDSKADLADATNGDRPAPKASP